MTRPTLAGPIVGLWRLTHLEGFGRDYLDLVGAAHVHVGATGTGSFTFGVISAELDLRPAERDDADVEFSWDGFDEGTPVSGRGHAAVHGENTLIGTFLFHLGDDHRFRATRTTREELDAVVVPPPKRFYRPKARRTRKLPRI